ncbi:maleylpyruvate isomerase family mycothiol-dependent enzyme [Phycicoccus sonneratiae]|uniref:Maleylpyruvate isomerase family mycothiol-dependent enzyme n=1 Tax=Phycicoccus sonneratiae TaxID=2807628 RepID=A0ABS2CHG0_9MICO|nr:maleylpyruvate isomerase family mycothiol-dependent enzyme [Phycicoccus sonneraticus]MBM6399240.1 maleylpyruvate isomerase family mycothiol-dependent enzyme [Phycicoccus sonneraticus]
MGPADTRPGVDLELLERSLAWTRGALAGVAGSEAGRPTPCAGWTLADLLVHMVDSLEVVTELSLGRVALAGPPPTSRRPEVLAEHLRLLGCALLDGWLREDRPQEVAVGSSLLDADVAVEVGALEIAVHGWDVARARGLEAPFPPLLAAALLPVAVRRVPVHGRGRRFAPPVRPSGTGPASLLLAHLGRS